MNNLRRLLCGAAVALLLSIAVIEASAAEYTFSAEAKTKYYNPTSCEDVCGTQYNYRSNVQIYGITNTAQRGAMEKPPMMDLAIGMSVKITEDLWMPNVAALISEPSQYTYTGLNGVIREGCSIGTISIPSLGLIRRVWEGETNVSMSKGVGHYKDTSVWNGNVGLCGHNRGSAYMIGEIKNLKADDIITYETSYGTRNYKVVFVKVISATDWSYLRATPDNRITLTTCLANQPEYRVCVQAVEV